MVKQHRDNYVMQAALIELSILCVRRAIKLHNPHNCPLTIKMDINTKALHSIFTDYVNIIYNLTNENEESILKEIANTIIIVNKDVLQEVIKND